MISSRNFSGISTPVRVAKYYDGSCPTVFNGEELLDRATLQLRHTTCCTRWNYQGWCRCSSFLFSTDVHGHIAGVRRMDVSFPPNPNELDNTFFTCLRMVLDTGIE